jgi:hypothetical protein
MTSTRLRFAASRAAAASVIRRIGLTSRADCDPPIMFAIVHPRESKTQLSQTTWRPWRGLGQLTSAYDTVVAKLIPGIPNIGNCAVHRRSDGFAPDRVGTEPVGQTEPP